MRSYPPQYPRSSNPLNPSSSLILFFLCPPHPLFLSFALFFLFFSSLSFCCFHFLFFLSSQTLPSFFTPFPPFWYSFYFFLLLVCVCVYLRMYVRAYLAIPYMSANDNDKHIKSNIRYVFYKKTNKMK